MRQTVGATAQAGQQRSEGTAVFEGVNGHAQNHVPGDRGVSTPTQASPSQGPETAGTFA